jgi:hypothetical protein
MLPDLMILAGTFVIVLGIIWLMWSLSRGRVSLTGIAFVVAGFISHLLAIAWVEFTYLLPL